LTLAASADDRLELASDRWRLVVATSQGGSLLACEHDGLPVLRSAALPAAPGRPAASACYFPLIPFSNRIENGRFRFGATSVRLAPNVAGSSHALHGHGWQADWQVTAQDGASCALSFRRAPTPDWPWDYRGLQTLAIAGDAVRFTLAIENLGAAPMPCGLGFHPYFARTAGTRLEFKAERAWEGGADSFPTARVAVTAPLCFGDGPLVVERQGTDHCFDGWTRRATIRDDHSRRTFVLESSEATPFVIVYVPADADYFCVEPVTHAVNAMNLADPAAAGWWTLAPGASRSIEMTIRCATP
jgi:aldose 1-epimerase